MADSWIATTLVEETAHAWKCASCGLIVGGAPVRERPGRCAVCEARAGAVVAVVSPAASPDALSMLVLDRRLFDLIAAYRAAKADHEREAHARALIHELGNYDMDGGTFCSDIAESASREQHSAVALADATTERVRVSQNAVPTSTRVSRPSVPSPRTSRTSYFM